MTSALFQDRKTGQRVLRVGALTTKEEFVPVKGNDGVPYYAQLADLMPCDDAGRPDFDAQLQAKEEQDEPIPPPIINVVENRVNVNTATAEELARRVPGIGYRIAKQIKEKQMTLPGEKYRNLEQIKEVSKRVNWDDVVKGNYLFIA